MPGPLQQLRARRSTARAHYLREVGRELGHRLLVFVVLVVLVGLALRVAMGR
jgi:hypothetical protein